MRERETRNEPFPPPACGYKKKKSQYLFNNSQYLLIPAKFGFLCIPTQRVLANPVKKMAISEWRENLFWHLMDLKYKVNNLIGRIFGGKLLFSLNIRLIFD